jgi:hypothetical protein
MLNLNEEITIASEGKTLFKGHVRRSIEMLAKTIADRGDPASVFSAEILVTLK